jgi:hypothetical protein
MAFAGVAKAFQVEHSLTYLAGIWAESFTLCLLWYGKGGIGEKPILPEVFGHPVPSWSWFSYLIPAIGDVNDPLRFTDDFLIKVDQFQGYICNGLWGKDITCAACVVLVLLRPLHKHFPHRYTSEIRHINRPYLWLRMR